MKTFNLFSLEPKKKIIPQNIVKINPLNFGIFGLLTFIIVVSIGLFIFNIYEDNQLKNKGTQIISLINDQSKSKEILAKMNEINNRKAAINTVTADANQRVQDIVRQIDLNTNDSVTSYLLSKSNVTATIKGVVADPNTATTIATSLRKVKTLNNVSLTQIQKVTEGYSYIILFDIKF